MTPDPIQLLRVAGSHRDVGRQIGEATAERLRAAVEFKDELAGLGRTREEQLALASGYRAVTEPSIPEIIEELDGCAEAAGVDPLALFAVSIEEIWYPPRASVTQGRCSDMVAGPSATADGHLLVAHNNDLSPSAGRDHARVVPLDAGRPRRRSGLAVPSPGGGRWDEQDRLLVRRRHERAQDLVRAREPLRLAGAGVYVPRLSAADVITAWVSRPRPPRARRP